MHDTELSKLKRQEGGVSVSDLEVDLLWTETAQSLPQALHDVLVAI